MTGVKIRGPQGVFSGSSRVFVIAKVARVFLLTVLFLFPLIRLITREPERYDGQPLIGEFWCELNPAIKEESRDYPLTRDAAVREMLEEARYIYSGIIYGFQFRYVPYDKACGTEEEFDLELPAEIKWGDPNLVFLEGRTDNTLLYGRFRYFPHSYQSNWINHWESGSFPMVGGNGKANLFKGTEQKYRAYEEAVKNAVREYVRQRVLNKPRQITGRIALSEVPHVFIDAGQYVANVMCKLSVKTVEPYYAY